MTAATPPYHLGFPRALLISPFSSAPATFFMLPLVNPCFHHLSFSIRFWRNGVSWKTTPEVSLAARRRMPARRHHLLSCDATCRHTDKRPRSRHVSRKCPFGDEKSSTNAVLLAYGALATWSQCGTSACPQNQWDKTTQFATDPRELRQDSPAASRSFRLTDSSRAKPSQTSCEQMSSTPTETQVLQATANESSLDGPSE